MRRWEERQPHWITHLKWPSEPAQPQQGCPELPIHCRKWMMKDSWQFHPNKPYWVWFWASTEFRSGKQACPPLEELHLPGQDTVQGLWLSETWEILSQLSPLGPRWMPGFSKPASSSIVNAPDTTKSGFSPPLKHSGIPWTPVGKGVKFQYVLCTAGETVAGIALQGPMKSVTRDRPFHRRYGKIFSFSKSIQKWYLSLLPSMW